MNKRILSMFLCVLMLLGMVLTPSYAQPAEKASAAVTVVAQAYGGFIVPPGKIVVEEDKAESYGYTDSVEGSVSVLDALVASHETAFGEDFTSETAGEYLSVSGGYISKLFGVETYLSGFMLNEGYPNDGSESSYGGYNGTTVETQQIKDGDKIDFYIYQDESYYSDIYTWIDGDLSVLPGETAHVSVSGTMAMMGYMYLTGEDFKEAGEPAEGVSLAWVDENGALSEIDGVYTDEDGDASFEIPSDTAPGTYYITAFGTDDYDSPVIMNPTAFVVTDEIEVSVSLSKNAVPVNTKDNEAFVRLPVTLSGKAEYNIDDVLLAAHNKYATEEYGYSSAQTAYGLSVTKLWGDESNAFGYYVNDNSAWSLLDTVSDGDFVSAFVYKDTAGWSDAYTKFEDAQASVSAMSEITLTLKKYDWSVYDYVACEGAQVSAAGFPDISGTTDSQGNVTLVFENEGTYTVIAQGESIPIVPASCTVTVSAPINVSGITALTSLTLTEGSTAKITYQILPENASDKSVTWHSEDESIATVEDGVVSAVGKGSTTITVTTNDGGFSASCIVTVNEAPNAISVMHKIAAKYAESGIAADANAPWFAADLSSYGFLYPQNDNLSDEQIQEYIDNLVAQADTASSPGDLSKYIIALRAMGFDPTKVMTSDFREVNVLKKLSDLIDENAPSVTNIYTLPYVIIAAGQNENYIGKEKLDSLVSSALSQKDSWQQTTWGPDAAAAMLLALAPYYNTNSQVKSTVDETVLIIKEKQDSTGLIGNAASTGLVISAFSALGIDSGEVKNNEKSLIDGIMTQASESLDGFVPTTNSFSTEQAFRGLVAWQLYKQNTNRSVFDFSSNPINIAQATWAQLCPVTFNVVPADASVVVEGQNQVSLNKYDLPEGSYSYSVQRNGYESKTGTFTVSNEEETKKTQKTISVSLASKPSSGSSGISVNISVLTHDARSCLNSYTYKNNASAYSPLASATVSINAGQTVFDALNTLLTQKGIPYVEKSYGYISSIGGISEFDHGTKSGWLFMVNNAASTKGCRDTALYRNSTVVFFYTDDYTKDYGSESWSSSASGSGGSGSSVVVTQYTVEFDTNGGSSVSSKKVGKNAVVSAPGAPTKSGYTFDGWYTEKALVYKYDFSSPVTGNLTLYAKWVPNDTSSPDTDKNTDNNKDEKLFDDVKKDDWFYNAVKYVHDAGIMKGTENGFEPDSCMSRAMLVMVLYRLENSPAPSMAAGFEDVKEGDWYADAVAWAFENEIVSGISETAFAPDDDIEREQMALIFLRYAKMKGYFSDISNQLSQYDDKDQISDWALEAFGWANAEGLITGTSENSISPHEAATRAQTATIIMRFIEKLTK